MLDAEQLQQLLLSTAWGNQQAFAALYDHTAPYLLTLATRFVVTTPQAEEVLQEAFVQIWYNAKSYDPQKGAAMAWLTTIVRSRALDARRRESRLAARHDAFARDQASIIDPVQHKPADYTPELQSLLDCLDHLQGPQRQSILLAYYNGHTHGEIAQQLSAPLGTIKSWIRRGLVTLRECLDA